MSKLSKESIVKILNAVTEVTEDRLDDMVYTAYMAGDLDTVDKIYHNDEDFDVIFRVDGELFKIKLYRNSYDDIYSLGRGVEGPLKPVEKTVTVYE